jgi:hypothetical protein
LTEKKQINEQRGFIMLSVKHFHELDEKIAKFKSQDYQLADTAYFLEKLLKVRKFFQKIFINLKPF